MVKVRVRVFKLGGRMWLINNNDVWIDDWIDDSTKVVGELVQLPIYTLHGRLLIGNLLK